MQLGRISGYKYKNSMVKVSLLNCLLLLLVLAEINTRNLQTSTQSLCDIKTYNSLKNVSSRGMKINDTMLDFFDVLNQTTYQNAIQVWQRFATYPRSPFMTRFIELVRSSYNVSKIYRALSPIQKILSFDYEQYCIDPTQDPTLPTYFILSPPSSLASSIINKPANYANQSKSCALLQNPFCTNTIATQAGNRDLYNDYQIMAHFDIYDRRMFWKTVDGQLQYTFTMDFQNNMITQACQEYKIFKQTFNNGGEPPSFTHNDRQKLAYQVDAQVQIDFLYILSKYKFGEQLGNIYNDCLKYGPL